MAHMASARSTGRQAIRTRYLGPTDHRGSRVVASCDHFRVIREWDDALGADENHARACRALADKLGWGGGWVGGAIGGDHYWVSGGAL